MHTRLFTPARPYPHERRHRVPQPARAVRGTLRTPYRSSHRPYSPLPAFTSPAHRPKSYIAKSPTTPEDRYPCAKGIRRRRAWPRATPASLIRVPMSAALTAMPPQPQIPMMPMRSGSTLSCTERKQPFRGSHRGHTAAERLHLSVSDNQLNCSQQFRYICNNRASTLPMRSSIMNECGQDNCGLNG